MTIIRDLRKEDNTAIELVVRSCLIEFGGNRAGLAWEDASLSKLFQYYNQFAHGAYWVAELDGQVVGGCGIAPFAESESICELQKMYLLPQIRGTGVAGPLLHTALNYARLHYQQCYLETLQTMGAANRFYAKHGFKPLAEPLAGSEHYACDAWLIKEL
ncbi:N-acetyltransferase [Paenibacillus sp. 1011MAR3C5]|uniref:GNAT family N-acetyltransferase n=1 Tax=Paenibacillus sp. 1011MAR3C5 TaxID=1675787 RepID=UPI000E6BB751|nr:GNAT family N-acetyltransferase [Paenibacillus sp. 1011MAR3C5]RJE90343.1 N-acetyltransferase [Paenibacillus sp. 1011MAR3C5]